MLQHDYILEIIQQFVDAVSGALSRALRQGDFEGALEVEAAVGELLQLDADTAMALSPESLVTMMQLAGTGDAVSGYVAYALERLSQAYRGMGRDELAQVRHEQAVAVASAFGSDLSEVPEEFRERGGEASE